MSSPGPSREEFLDLLVREGELGEWERDIADFLLRCLEQGRCRPRDRRERRWLYNLKRANCATRRGELIGDPYFIDNELFLEQLSIWILCALGLVVSKPTS